MAWSLEFQGRTTVMGSGKGYLLRREEDCYCWLDGRMAISCRVLSETSYKPRIIDRSKFSGVVHFYIALNEAM